MGRNLTPPLLFTLFLLITFAVSCRKDAFKNDNAQMPVLASVSKDTNFVSMSVAGVAAIQNSLMVGRSRAKAVNANFTLTTKQVLDSLAGPDPSNPSYYIFNYVGGGFAIVAADKRVMPILAYSDEGYFALSGEINAGLADWLKVTHKNIEAVKSHRELKALEQTVEMWRRLLERKPGTINNIVSNGLKIQHLPPVDTCEERTEVLSVGPLLQTAWDQRWPYNALCPAGAYSNYHAPTGCVATSVAQVVNYWHYPASYNYSSMPSGIPYIDDAYYPSLAQLMVDAGSSVDMEYHDYEAYPSVHVGIAYVRGKYASEGLKSNFGFTSADHVDYSTGKYFDIIANLNNHWPVILSASTDNYQVGPWSYYYNGHTWVCDGYMEFFFYTCETETSQPNVSVGLIYHMNWGWGGGTSRPNGYYSFDDWTVLVNGGYQHYVYNRAIDYNIHP